MGIQFIKKGGSSTFKVPNGLKFSYSSYIPNNLDFSETTDMDHMFAYLQGITSLPQINTSNATTAKNMFTNSSLTSLPQIDISKVTIASNFCSSCSSLTSIPILDTSNITNAQYFCNNCYRLY